MRHLVRFSLVAIVLASWLGCDGAEDASASRLGDVRDASIGLVACNSTLERRLAVTVAAGDVDVHVTSAQLAELVGGNGAMTVDALVPAGHTFVVACVDRVSIATPFPAGSGEGSLTIVLEGGDELDSAELDVTFESGGQAWDNCQNLFTNTGCSLSDP